MSRLEIRTLGSLEVLVDGRRLDLGTLKQRALLSLLLINRGRAVSADRIVMALWGPDAPPKRRSDVWVYVSRLRKALEPAGELVGRVDGGYRLDAATTTVDAAHFESLAEEGRRLLMADPPAASLVLGEALALWKGDAYAEFATTEFAAGEVVRLEEARLSALELRIQADLAWLDSGTLISEIESMVTLHPLRPSFTASLMLALYRRGRQADALSTYGTFADRLAEETGLEPPPELRALEERILMDDPALRPASTQLPIRLPAPIASFVGRAIELAEVADAVKDHRLVVLTGPGGVGKTTLALEVGRRLALQYDGTAFIDLTATEDLEDVTPSLGRALRVRATGPEALDVVLSRLGDRTVLALLDNCEVAPPKAIESIVALLEGAPGLRVLATSRTTLGIPGEQVVRVAPMGTDRSGDGLALLRERISALPGSTSNAVTDAELLTIVERTEGLPLAIELAAAQLTTWSAAEVISALDDPLGTLIQAERTGPERHRAIRSSIAWSERLLPAPAAELLARLSVFRSSFTFEAICAIAGIGTSAGGEEGHQLRRLVDASLVLVEPGDPSRYRLLGPVRDYAQDRLTEAGHAKEVAERHARYFVESLENLDGLASDAKADALQRIHAEVNDLLAAIRWTIRSDDAVAAQRATARAVPLLRRSSSFTDTLAMVEAALAVSNRASRSRAELLFVAAPLWVLVRGPNAWSEQIEELTELADLLGDPEVIAWAAMRQADAAAANGDEPDHVSDLYREAVTAMHKTKSAYVTYAYHQFAWYLLWIPDRLHEAKSVGAEWLGTARDLRLPYEELLALEFGAQLALAIGDHELVEAQSAAAAAGYRRLGSHRDAAHLMSGLAIASLQRGDAEEALRRIDVGLRAKLEVGAWPWVQTDRVTRACAKVVLGDHSGAAADLLAAVGLGEDKGEWDPSLAHVAVRVLAGLDPRTAATILGAAERVLAPPSRGPATRMLLPALDRLTGDPVGSLRESLGSEAFEAAWESGAALDLPSASALVRESLQRLAGEAQA